MIELLLLGIVGVPLYSLYLDHRARGWYFFNPANSFWLAFIYAGAVQPYLSRDKWIPFYSEATFTSTLAMFLVLGLAVHLGYNARFGPPLARKIPAFPVPDMRKVFWCGVILLGIGLVGYLVVIGASGGWASWSADPRGRTNFLLSGYVYTLPRVATLGIMVLLCHAFSIRSSSQFYRLFIVALALLNLAWQVYSGTREGTITMLIILVGSVYGAQNRNPPLPAIGVMVAMAFFVFGFIPTYRAFFRDLKFDTLDTPSQIVQNSFDFYGNPDGEKGVPSDKPDLWSDFGMAISVNHYVPSQVDFDYGQMLLEAFTRPIPRALWPDKSYPEGEAWDRFHRVSHISDSLNPAGLRSGPSPTMVGKYYYIGGWLGLVLGGFFSGTLLRALAYYLRRNRHLVTGAIFAVASAGLGAMEMIHPLSWSVNLWLPTIAFPFAIMVWLVRDTNPSATALVAIAGAETDWESATPANATAPVAANPNTLGAATPAALPIGAAPAPANAYALVDPRFRRAAEERVPRAPAPANLRSPRFDASNGNASNGNAGSGSNGNASNGNASNGNASNGNAGSGSNGNGANGKPNARRERSR